MFVGQKHHERMLAAQRQELEQQVGGYRNELQAIRENLAYIAFTPDGVILEANETFLDCTGYSPGWRGTAYLVYQRQL